MASLDPGQRSKRVTIQQRQVTRNRDGSESVVWVDYCKRWAAILPTRGAERWQSDTEIAEIQFRVLLDSDSKTRAIQPDMRVRYREQIYNIRAVMATGERNRSEIELPCTQQVFPKVSNA